MTDEEMAEEYVNNQGKNNILDFGENHIDVSLIKREAFLAGLKADRQKWHKVAEVLPISDKDKMYLILNKWNNYMFARFYEGKWSNYTVIENVVAWCEIPIYTEV